MRAAGHHKLGTEACVRRGGWAHRGIRVLGCGPNTDFGEGRECVCLLGNNVHSWGPGRDPVTAACGNFIDFITCTAISKNTTAPPGRLCVIHLQYLQGAGACKFRGRSRSRRAGKAAALVGGDGEGVAAGLGRAVHADLLILAACSACWASSALAFCSLSCCAVSRSAVVCSQVMHLCAIICSRHVYVDVYVYVDACVRDLLYLYNYIRSTVENLSQCV